MNIVNIVHIEDNIDLDGLIYTFVENPTLDTLYRINDLVDDKDNMGRIIIDINDNTLLHVRQSEETMKYLLDRGGLPNSINRDGITPVLLQRDYNVIRLLERKGANLNHKDNYNFGIFHWQKDPQITEYLIKNDIDIHSYNSIYEPKSERIYSNRNRMLIEGGYDPYNEKYITIPGYFLQRDFETIYTYLKLRLEYFPQYINSFDLFCESILFKSFLTKKEIALYISGGENVNFFNLLGMTPIFIHHDRDIINKLISNGADLEYKNNIGNTPLNYHKTKNNLIVAKLIEYNLSAKKIQRSWKRWLFKKNLIPFKNYLQKKEFLQELYYKPPINDSDDYVYFKGGLGYREALKEFTLLSSLQGSYHR